MKISFIISSSGQRFLRNFLTWKSEACTCRHERICYLYVYSAIQFHPTHVVILNEPWLKKTNNRGF